MSNDTTNFLGEPLDIVLLDTDQPATCPQCGCRTEFTELSTGDQKHTCLNFKCRFIFIGTFEEN